MGKCTRTCRSARIEIAFYELSNDGDVPFLAAWRTTGGRIIYEIVGMGVGEDRIRMDHTYVEAHVAKYLNEEMGIPIMDHEPIQHNRMRPDGRWEENPGDEEYL